MISKLEFWNIWKGTLGIIIILEMLFFFWKFHLEQYYKKINTLNYLKDFFSNKNYVRKLEKKLCVFFFFLNKLHFIWMRSGIEKKRSKNDRNKKRNKNDMQFEWTVMIYNKRK